MEAMNMSGNYTSNLIDEYIEFAEQTYNGSGNEREFVERTANFRNFSQRMVFFYNQRNKTEFSSDEVASALKGPCSKIGANRNTIGNWVTGKSIPVRNEKTRENLFKVAFVMNLSAEETEEMFCKVFLDRAFNPRSKRDFIYYYCLKNGLDYGTAAEIIGAVSEIPEGCPDGEIKETRVLRQSLISAGSTKEIIDFIKANPSSFGELSCTEGLRRLKTLYELLASENKNGKCGLAEKESEFRSCVSSELDYFEHGKERTSVESILKVITQIDTRSREAASTVTKARGSESKNWNHAFCSEILNDFPGRNSIPEYITQKSPSAEVNQFLFLENCDSYNVRRWLILFHFYAYWAEAFLQCCDNEFEVVASYNPDDYVSTIDNLLYECGLPLLYAGNPYDWLFMYCAEMSNFVTDTIDTLADPIYILRDILLNLSEGFYE